MSFHSCKSEDDFAFSPRDASPTSRDSTFSSGFSRSTTQEGQPELFSRSMLGFRSTDSSTPLDVSPVQPRARSMARLPGGPASTEAGRKAAAGAAEKAFQMLKKDKCTASAPSLPSKDPKECSASAPTLLSKDPKAKKLSCGYAIRRKSLTGTLKDFRQVPQQGYRNLADCIPQGSVGRVEVPDPLSRPLKATFSLPKEVGPSPSIVELGETRSSNVLEEFADKEADSLRDLQADFRFRCEADSTFSKSLQHSYDVCDEESGAQHGTISMPPCSRQADEKKKYMLETLAAASEEFHETGDVHKFQRLLRWTLHNDVTAHTHGLHSDPHRTEIAQMAAKLFFSKTGTENCDGIEEMIKSAVSRI